MSKTTYTAGVDLFLVDGEICIYSKNKRNMLYSTGNNYPKGVHLLDRNRFVKGEDLDELALKLMPNVFNRNQAIEVFKAGYKANKNEFTREDMEKAYLSGSIYGNLDQLIRHLRPLSLPVSVTIENKEIIEVKWK